jgi:hypothetical protein
MTPYGSVSTLRLYGLNNRGSIPRQGQILFSSPLRPDRSIHPPIQRTLGALTPEAKWPECEADPSLPFNAEVKNAWSYNLHSFIRLHGVVFLINLRGKLYVSSAAEFMQRRIKRQDSCK